MKLKNLKIISLCVLFLVFTGSVFKGEDDIYDKINKNLDVIGKVYREVTLNYVDEIDADKFVKAGIDGMLNTLDPYTSYFDENSRDQIDLITLGKYGGVGITVGFRDSIVTITEIMNGYEAQRKGLRRGDQIIELDGTPVTNLKIEELRRKVRGAVGSQIRFKILRDEETIDFDLTREEIILKNISYTGYIDDKNKGIGYIKLERFTQNSDTEFENSLKTLLASGPLNGLILDLRGNGGGLLDAAVGILNNLVDKNSLLVIIKGRNINTEKKYFSNKEPLLPKNIPLAVLIDSNTASASEIVAGAIQDLDRGVIIGNTSFGKGLVQQFKDLNPESQLKITLSRYFTPSGRWIQEKNYFKENKSGVFLNKDLFSITDFKTLNGRKVSAFGGISPDIKFGVTIESDIHKDLINKDLIFRFANNYLMTNPVNGLFRSDDRTFDEFKSYLNSTGYNYNSLSDRKVNELRNIAAGKNFGDNYNQLLDQLSDQIAAEELSELNSAKDEILKSIEIEINKRQVSEKEQIEARFPADVVLMEALRVITDRSLYDSYLKPF
ncbi:MAG TPA: S41 family peptidase [Ignavibacteria bacterium]|nr:S41 family peptidase [Ignavibacteria bacterium]